jgi:ubiquinone/menaquinone biosynthesis C-methylase UbiE
MAFSVPAESYDRFMGRYSRPLAPRFADFAGVATGQRVLDVGCGTGALTSELVARLGAKAVAAVDPSQPFVAAMRDRFPELAIAEAEAEALPFASESFDVALAQLVVHFMGDPVRGISEMARVTRTGGTVAACVWDHFGGHGPLAAFWESARVMQPGAHDESALPGVREGDLDRLFRGAGLSVVETSALTIEVSHPSFEEWWQPFTAGVGPAGQFIAGLEQPARDRLRSICHDRLGSGPFVVRAVAWAARGRP